MHRDFANILVTDRTDLPILALLYGICPPIKAPFFSFYIFNFFAFFVPKQNTLYLFYYIIIPFVLTF